MTKSKGESARRMTDRIQKLDRRRSNIMSKRPNDSQLAEASAIEWAIPILEKYVKDTCGFLPPYRTDFYKHDKSNLIQSLIRRDGDKCYLCSKTIIISDMTIDHVVPLIKAGANDSSNYRLTHEKCNMLKGHMLYEDFKETKYWKLLNDTEANLI